MHSNYLAPNFPASRPRRLRQFPWLRNLVQEHQLNVSDLIWPIFIREGQNQREAVASLPGVDRLSIDLAVEAAKFAASLGIPLLALFPYTDPSKRSANAEEAFNPDNLVNRATKAIKAAVPEIGIMLDVALDPYSDHGHDGILYDGNIDNDRTIDALIQQSIVQAQSGADILGPSDMMDGRVQAMRSALDGENFQNCAIMSYSAKFASGFYGPFRDAVGASNILKGDKKTYQLNPANASEAMAMIARDLKEGADMVMVKPGLPYLDICQRARAEFAAPIFAYQVSGEYAMLQNAIEAGLFQEEAIILETMMSFKRAGCNGVLTYFAPKIAQWLNDR